MDDDTAANATPDPEPLPPREPDASACCQTGCAPCIYDLYWDAVAQYEQDLALWQARQGNAHEK